MAAASVRLLPRTITIASLALVLACEPAPAYHTHDDEPPTWRRLAVSDSVTVSLDTTSVRPARDSSVFIQLRYDYARPQGRERAAEFRLRDRESLPPDFRFHRLETVEYAACAPDSRYIGLLQATFIDDDGRPLARRVVDTRDPRGFPWISGDSVARAICGLLSRGEVRTTDSPPQPRG